MVNESVDGAIRLGCVERARKLHAGENPTVEKDNDKNTVIALREIADETLSIDQLKNDLVEEYQTATLIEEEIEDTNESNNSDENNDDNVRDLIEDNLSEIKDKSVEDKFEEEILTEEAIADEEKIATNLNDSSVDQNLKET